MPLVPRVPSVACPRGSLHAPRKLPCLLPASGKERQKETQNTAVTLHDQITPGKRLAGVAGNKKKPRNQVPEQGVPRTRSSTQAAGGRLSQNTKASPGQVDYRRSYSVPWWQTACLPSQPAQTNTRCTRSPHLLIRSE